MTERQLENVLNRQIRQIRSGVAKSAYVSSRRDARVSSIRRCLESPNLDRFLEIAIELEAIGWIDGAAGVVAVWDNRDDGWPLIQSSFACSCLNVRICQSLYKVGRLKTGWSTTHLNLAARCLAHAMAVGDNGFAEWCGNTLIANFQTGVGLYDRSPSAFDPFMLQLFATAHEVSMTAIRIPCAPLGVYGELLDAWNNDRRFASALIKICDYHIERSIEERAAHSEFVSVPHNLFPAEILAAKRIRGSSGLQWPDAEHPLLRSPLAELPSSLPGSTNEIVDQVASAAHLYFQTE